MSRNMYDIVLDHYLKLNKIVKLPVGDLWRSYEKLQFKKGSLSLDIHFNQECLRKKITPKYASIKLQPKQHSNLIPKFVNIILHQEIKHKYNNLDKVEKCLLLTQVELISSGINAEYYMKDSAIRSIVSVQLDKKSAKLSKKVDNLLQSQNVVTSPPLPPFQFMDRVINLSGMPLDDEETQLLYKGPKFCPGNQKSDLTTMLIDINAACSTTNSKHHAVEKTTHYKPTSPFQKVIESLNT
ncbi:hypothetical protein M8J77_019031 [Diaphorina citri]|nr:hypothetical protein M8J77_019031 [Diaphorina citri]